MVISTKCAVLVFSGMVLHEQAVFVVSTDGKDVFFGSLQGMVQIQVTISSKIYISVAVLDLRRGVKHMGGKSTS